MATKSKLPPIIVNGDKPASIREIYKPEGIEKKMLQRIYQRQIAMRDAPERKKAEQEWTRGRKQWEAAREERRDDEWQSNHYVPLTTAVIESALAEVIDESPQPFIMPRGQEDTPKTTVMSHIYEYTWETADSDLEFEDIIHDAFIEGTGIGQEYFYSDIRRIKTSRKTPEKEGGNALEWKEEDQESYNDCYLEAIKNDDFFVDENARGFRGPYAARDCIRRYIMHIDDFRNFFKGPVWDPLGNSKFVKPGGDTNYYEWYKPPQGLDHSHFVEVLWYWSIKPDDWLCIIANDVMVVMGPNPYKHKELPFARAVDVKRTHKFYGKGEAALLESVQDELNTLRRMIIDRNHLDIDKMFIGSNRLNLSEEDLIARPHGYIPSDDPNSVKAIEYEDIPRSVELSMGHLDDDSTIVTGINPRAQSLPTTGTATEAAILKESTLKRIRLKVRRIEREFLTRIAQLRVSNILQYYPEAKMEKIVGTQGTQEFESEMADLESKGLVETLDNGEKMKKTYRKIRLKGVELSTDATGQLRQNPSPQPYTFFELDPKYFLPNQGGYDIKFEAGSSLPISKPLLQQKTTEMYDRLIQIAIGVPGLYDPKKLGDMLIEANDMNPADLSVDQQQSTPQDDAGARLQMMIELANTENNLLMHGQPIAPHGTPFAPPAHTLIHTRFTGSPTFQSLKSSDPKIKEMVDHITGEIAAQEERQNQTVSNPLDPNAQGGQPTPAPAPGAPLPSAAAQPGVGVPSAPKAQAGGNKLMGNIMPSKIQGGGQAPAAI